MDIRIRHCQLLKTLDDVIKLERQSYHAYIEAAETVKNEKIKKVLETMAELTEDHARRVERVRYSLYKIIEHDPAETIGHLLIRLKSSVQELISEVGAEKEALRKAAEFEHGFAVFYANLAGAFRLEEEIDGILTGIAGYDKNFKISALFEELSSQELEHEAVLEKMAMEKDSQL